MEDIANLSGLILFSNGLLLPQWPTYNLINALFMHLYISLYVCIAVLGPHKLGLLAFWTTLDKSALTFYISAYF